MKTAAFDYHLPPELIAQTPVEPRDASRLMVVRRSSGEILHCHFRDLPEFLRAGDRLVHNESRVIPARLFARKETGGKAEIILLRQRTAETWETLVGGKRVRRGAKLLVLNAPAGEPVAEALVLEEGERGLRILRFDRPALPLAEQVGVLPLPPYIHEQPADAERYQTIYARTPGSAAAPTAGLHFTPRLLRELQERGIRSLFVTLHVGPDTFRPVGEEDVEEHRMHSEYCTLPPPVAEELNRTWQEGRRVVAVGTTGVRVLESAAVARHVVRPFDGMTALFIYPGYQFRAVDALITNFHLPRSTLLMLVSAFAGKDLIDRAYAEAIRRRYRFYSFGDVMLIL